jgi:pimeloyl-ACP methyl ester carboxylesterase
VPEHPVPGRRRAILTSNIGMHHRVGPFRMYVELARALSAMGWWVLRFDHSGIGDSAPRTDGSDVVEGAARDLVDAMDFLRDQQGIEEFVIVGLCSGVDGTHQAAIRDARVRGAVFIDGYSYPTNGYYLRRYVHRYFDGGRWVRFVQRRWRRMTSPAHRVNPAAVVFDRTYPPRETFARDIRGLQARGVRLYFIYTGTVSQTFNSEEQLFEMLGSDAPRTGITVNKIDNTDHLFTRLSARADLLARLRDWVERFDV